MAQAKQQLSEVVRRAARSPQLLMNRDTPVAAVISADDLDEFLRWREGRHKVSLGEALRTAAGICEAEQYTLEVPARADRSNAWAEEAHGSRRHQRSE